MIATNQYPGGGFDIDFTYPVDVSTWTITGSIIAGGVVAASVAVTRPTVYVARLTVTGAQSRAFEGRQIIVRSDAVDPGRSTVPVTEEIRVNIALETSVAAVPAGRQVVWNSFAPVAGIYTQGDVCWNSAAAVGQPQGWLCTVSGTPGTWVSMGVL